MGIVSGRTTEGSVLRVDVGDRRIDVSPAVARQLTAGPEPQVGDLLLYGMDQRGPWYLALQLDTTDPAAPPGCFQYDDLGVEDGRFIGFDAGFRLPRAAGFEGGPAVDGRFANPGAEFCVNDRGEVFRYG